MDMAVFRSLDLFSEERCEYFKIGEGNIEWNSYSSPYSVMGLGRSLTGAFFGNGTCVLQLSESDPRIELDKNTLLLRVSAAASIAQVYNYLIQRGFMLASLPSYPAVTVGGCIAANVHGQNHYREGCFGENLVNLVLDHPVYGIKNVSRQNDPELFELTIGGFGLTGVIREATLRVHSVANDLLELSIRRFDSIVECYYSLMADREEADYFHSWADLTRLSADSQKGFYFRGVYKTGCEGHRTKMLPEKVRNSHLPWKPRIFNDPVMKLLNQIYYYGNTWNPKTQKSLSDFIFPSKSRLWYFSMFGKEGIIEHQVLIPHEAVRSYCRELTKALYTAQPPITLCHMKIFRGRQKLLYFDGDGFCLAMHFRSNKSSLKTLERLDRINVDHGVITNIIKDSRVDGKILRLQYPDFDDFLQKIHRYDANGYFRNTISDKLTCA